jgi:glutamyl-tRNA synthetase
MNQNVVVRFAPSPTGYLHVGGARTAVFNWLFARHTGGRFALRIEDTDKARSSEEMTREILDGLKWLGVTWDGDPWVQSERIERHREECLRLLSEDKAYWCYCDPAELERKRTAAGEEGADPKYDRTCFGLSAAERASRDAAGTPRALRFRVPPGETNFYDIVHEGTVFGNGEIDDFVILRSDGTPMYMVAVVVDDHDMGITHVIRGDDHLSNTPKQILLYQALGYEAPMFGHVPLILGSDKKRLSKRHGATSVGEYQSRGYLPEALFNFLALLGWSPGDDREMMSRKELVDAFDVRRLLKKSSEFDEDKLRWLNGKHIRALTDGEILDRLRPYKPARYAEVDDAYLLRVITLMRERMFSLSDLFDNGAYFFRDPGDFDAEGVRKHWKPDIAEYLARLAGSFESTVFEAAALEELVRNAAAETGLSAGKLIHPLRLALTGGTSSPSLFDVMAVLGLETCRRRIRRATDLLARGESLS